MLLMWRVPTRTLFSDAAGRGVPMFRADRLEGRRGKRCDKEERHWLGLSPPALAGLSRPVPR